MLNWAIFGKELFRKVKAITLTSAKFKIFILSDRRNKYIAVLLVKSLDDIIYITLYHKTMRESNQISKCRHMTENYNQNNKN